MVAMVYVAHITSDLWSKARHELPYQCDISKVFHIKSGAKLLPKPMLTYCQFDP